jgi:hypothetical protein
MSFFRCALAVAAIFLLAPAALAGQQEMRGESPRSGAPPLIVLELYTSQGCSFCPPADELLARLADEPGVLGLTLAIDYWDHLGWRDTLAHPEHTARQEYYNRNIRHRSVYTPQVVVDGFYFIAGSREHDVREAIRARREAARKNPSGVLLDVRRKDGKLVIDLDSTGDFAALMEKAGTGSDVSIWLMPYRNSIDVRIRRGANRGRTVTYRNVVEGLTHVGNWLGEKRTISVPLVTPDADGHAVLVQHDGKGWILAAARVEKPVR